MGTNAVYCKVPDIQWSAQVQSRATNRQRGGEGGELMWPFGVGCWRLGPAWGWNLVKAHKFAGAFKFPCHCTSQTGEASHFNPMSKLEARDRSKSGVVFESQSFFPLIKLSLARTAYLCSPRLFSWRPEVLFRYAVSQGSHIGNAARARSLKLLQDGWLSSFMSFDAPGHHIHCSGSFTSFTEADLYASFLMLDAD